MELSDRSMELSVRSMEMGDRSMEMGDPSMEIGDRSTELSERSMQLSDRLMMQLFFVCLSELLWFVGIGYEIVKRFYNEGATVFVIDKDQTLLDNIQNEMPKLMVLTQDLNNWEETQAAVLGITPLDHLVNNAGFLQAQRLIDATPQNFDM